MHLPFAFSEKTRALQQQLARPCSGPATGVDDVTTFPLELHRFFSWDLFSWKGYDACCGFLGTVQLFVLLASAGFLQQQQGTVSSGDSRFPVS